MIRRKRSRPVSGLNFQSLEQRRLLAALANGQEIVDTVVVGEAKTYEIEVTTPGRVFLSVGETFNFDSVVEVVIESPSDAFVGADAGESGVDLEFDAFELGTYQVTVNDINNSNGFQFRIRSLAISQPFDLLESRDQFLANGEEFFAALPENSLSIFQFAVAAADEGPSTVLLASSRLDPLFGSQIIEPVSIHRPDGSEVFPFFFENQVFSVDQSEAGIYSVVVRGGNEFRFRSLVLDEPTIEPILGRDALLANGQETIVRVPVGAANLIQFDLEADQTTFLSVALELDSDEMFQWDLRAPNGESVFSGDQFDPFVEFQPDSTGRYTLVIRENNFFFEPAPVDVRVRVLSVPGTQEFVSGRDEALVNGARVASALPTGGFNAYTLEFDEPGNVLLLLESSNEFVGVELLLIGPDGNVTDGRFFFDDEIADFAINQPGVHTVLLRDRDGNAEGDTEIGLRPLIYNGDSAPVLSDVEQLQNNDLLVTPVLENELFVFQFSATQGDEVEFAYGGFEDVPLTVFGPTGDQVFSENLFAGSTQGFLSQESGVFTGVVDLNNFTFGGPDRALLFSMRLFVSDQDTPLAITFQRDNEPAGSTELLARPDELSNLTFEFSAGVFPAEQDFIFRRLGDPAPVDVFLGDFSYDPLSRIATFDSETFGIEVEPGYYTVEIPAGSIQVAGSNPGNDAFMETFYVALPGDANLDGTVDVLGDAFAVVANLGVTEGARWTGGDFNGDGQVTVLDDAFTLVENLGRSVTTPADVAQASQIAIAQAAVQELTRGDDEEVSVTTANSRDIVFASFDDESDEESDLQLSIAILGNPKVSLAQQLTLS